MLIHWVRDSQVYEKSACRGSNPRERQRKCGVITMRLARIRKSQKPKQLINYHFVIRKSKIKYKEKLFWAFANRKCRGISQKSEVRGVFYQAPVVACGRAR